MSDDIATRLRENCDTSDCVNVRSIALVKCDNCDAADEIERLRAEVDSTDAKAYANLRRLYDKRGDEIEQLRTLVRELQSETHRLEKLVNYGQ